MTVKLKSRLWLEADGKIILGEGRLRLLEAIQEHGSINHACKSIGMSYKKAWRLIDKMNSTGKEAMVEKKTGGTGGGGTIITDYGQSMMHSFVQMRDNVWQFMDREEKKFKQNIR